MNDRPLWSRGAAVGFLVLLVGASAAGAPQTGPGAVVMRPVISEQVSPLEAIAPVAADGVVGEGFLRTPPGEGPFPAVLLIHGGAPRWPTGELRDFALHTHASRFLEAGYVVAVMTRRDLDLGLPPSAEQGAVRDTIAFVDYLKGLTYVDAESVVLRGTSVGGLLALEAGAAREVAAILVEEPFSMPFVGVSGGGGQSAADQYRASGSQEKIGRLRSPVLLIRGDQTPNINDFNRDVFIPAMQAEGKSLKVSTYPGELHSFAFYNNAERTPRPGVALEAFEEILAFFRDHVATPPVPPDPALVEHVRVETN